MQTFDKLKIVVNSNNYIDNIDTNEFNTIIKDETITQYRYQQTSPYLLYIEKDLVDDELIIEFTGKILGPRYCELINRNNIRQCLENINALGLCSLDIDGILANGMVVKADVTKDCICGDIPSLTREIKSCVKNHDRYTVTMKGGNLIIEKNVKTRNRKLRLTIYDKEKEINLQENRQWLRSITSEEAQNLMTFFKGKARFEMNLNSVKAIRDMLHIRENDILSVLWAEADPISSFLNEALVDNVEAKEVRTLHDAERMALLKEHDYDMKAVESVIKLFKSPNTNLSQAMKPYRELYNTLHNEEATSVKERLRGMLLEIFLVGFIVLF